MELTSPKNIKENYIKTLSTMDEYSDILNILVNKSETDPIYTAKELNYEEPPSLENEQRELLEVAMDINSINNGIFEMKNKISELVNYVDYNIDSVKSAIKKEDDRISDINIICGQTSDYNMVIPIYSTDFSGSFENIDDKYFGANITEQEQIEYTITSISGNGIAGNRFVYRENGIFENEENDYSKEEYINDDNDVTKFEYSRLFTNDKEEVVDGIINYDDKDVEVTITLSADTKFNKIKWMTETKDLIVTKLETSTDGIYFTSQTEKQLKNESAEDLYNDSTYIYGSNILCFPYSYYVRITFTSSNVENDIIAIEEDNGVMVYSSTRRKKIAINNIKLYKSAYKSTSIVSGNIIVGGSVDKVALFSSEYIPNHFTDKKYITYYLIINGDEQEVVPVNSDKEGIKIIKFSETDSSPTLDSWIKTIKETIKTVQIKAVIETPNDNETPYIGNLKLCLEKETGSIYV